MSEVYAAAIAAAEARLDARTAGAMGRLQAALEELGSAHAEFTAAAVAAAAAAPANPAKPANPANPPGRP